jgi:hypothetical protein
MEMEIHSRKYKVILLLKTLSQKMEMVKIMLKVHKLTKSKTPQMSTMATMPTMAIMATVIEALLCFDQSPVTS